MLDYHAHFGMRYCTDKEYSTVEVLREYYYFGLLYLVPPNRVRAECRRFHSCQPPDPPPFSPLSIPLRPIKRLLEFILGVSAF